MNAKSVAALDNRRVYDSSEADDAAVVETSYPINTTLVILRGDSEPESTLQLMALDASLPVQERTRVMRQAMLAPYNERRTNALTIENVRPHAVIWKGQNRVTRVHDSTVRPP